MSNIMSKPLNENLRNVRIENDNGDLLPLLDHAGEQFAELVKAIGATNKAGTLTLKVDVKPSTAGALAVKASVVIKKPKGLPPESLLWATPDGNLIADDPRQIKMELKPVAAEPARELKTVTA
jgi:hypothetical protein